MVELSERERKERLELTAHLLERVMAVNGFFITAGYGTFFGIWAISKDSLGIHERRWACLFLLMSAGLFVAWHVIGIVMINVTMRLVAAEPSEGWAARVTAGIQQRTAKAVQRYGMLVTGVSLALALAGVATLAVGVIRAL